MSTGAEDPAKPGVQITNALTVKLDGNGGITHVVDGLGSEVYTGVGLGG